MKLTRISTQALACMVMCFAALILSSSAHAQEPGYGGVPYAVSAPIFTYNVSFDPDSGGGQKVTATGYGQFYKTPGSFSGFKDGADVEGNLTVDGVLINLQRVDVSDDPSNPSPFMFSASSHLNPGLHHVQFYYGAIWTNHGPSYTYDQYVTIP